MNVKIKKIFSGLGTMIRRNAKRVMPVTVMLIIFSAPAFAAADPFADATSTIRGYAGSVKNRLYAIAAIIALVGAFNVYHKMQNGDQDVKKTIMLTLGGCIAMLALSEALPAFFGTTV